MTRIRITTRDPAKDKDVLCGFIEDDRFYRSVNNRHYMVKENGYGMQIDALEKLVKYGVKEIVLTTHTGTRLTSKPSAWVTKGKKRNYGNGAQIFLDTKFMLKV